MTKYQNINFRRNLEGEEAISERFHELLSDFMKTLEDEAWLGEDSWDVACDFQEDVDLAWHAIAEEAAEIEALRSTFRTLPLQRMAGLIGRAIEAESLEDLADAFARSTRCVQALCPLHSEMCRDLVHEAHEGLNQMVCEAAAQQAHDRQTGAFQAQSLRLAA